MEQAVAALVEVTSQAFDRLAMAETGPMGEWLAGTGPKLDRIKRLQAIEDGIIDLLPDADEAADILVALTESLRSRYEAHAADALLIADEFRAALSDVEPPADSLDEMTLAKDAAIAESER